MNTKIKFRMLMTALALVFTMTAFAQETRSYETIRRIGGYEIAVTYKATFEEFATQLQVHNTKLYVVSGPASFETAAKNKGLKKEVIPNLGGGYTLGYPISRFTVYLKGNVALGSNDIYKAPFKVQLSNGLGDFTTPEFSKEAKDFYKNEKDVWEKFGHIIANDVETTQVYLDDFETRITQ